MPTTTRRYWKSLLLVGVLAMTVSSSGCMNYMIALGYLIGGPPSIEPDFDKMTNLSMTAEGVTAAVVCTTSKKVKYQFDNIDNEIAKYVTHRLHQKQIKVFNPDVVRDWLDKHEDWDKEEELGEALEATYVISIDLHNYTLFEENSVNLHRGRAECMVSVIEMDEDGSGERIYSKELISVYPLAMPRPTSEVSYDKFKREYLSRLSEEIGRLFYEYYNGDDIPDAT